ncbi:MAG: TetR family transcriptional regulator C-terminal domain-containing protein [Clostridia bacterium]|nr:TetR family transcriptional regulator C-terminal domain-containing protein [Clostridia bacterium]
MEGEDLELISSYLSGGNYCLLKAWLLEDIKKTPKDIFELIIRLTNLNMLNIASAKPRTS